MKVRWRLRYDWAQSLWRVECTPPGWAYVQLKSGEFLCKKQWMDA